MNNLALIDLLRQEGIRDEKVLNAMSQIDRKHFVSSSLLDSAYENRPLSIGEGQTISQPYIVALMTEALRLKPADRVLEIGTGSGYQAAILSKLCRQVYTLEVYPSLSEEAATCFLGLGLINITPIIGSGFDGLAAHAPYDAIILTAAPEAIPPILLEQLVDGGRLCAPVGKPNEDQTLLLITRQGEQFKEETLCGVRFVPMV
jgi:protein-L-isoaspartate(D-aspartate) O-methyltransferase